MLCKQITRRAKIEALDRAVEILNQGLKDLVEETSKYKKSRVDCFLGTGAESDAEQPAVEMDLTIVMMVGSHIEKYLPTIGRQIGNKINTEEIYNNCLYQ